jgi:hypothetical protein
MEDINHSWFPKTSNAFLGSLALPVYTI